MYVMLSLSDLPEDIVIGILLRLPAKYLLRLRFVCKYWFHLISDPKFVKAHLNLQASSNKPPVVMTSRLYCGGPLKSVNCCLDDNDGDHVSGVQQQQQQQQVTLRRFKKFWGSCNGLLCMKVLGITTSEDEDIKYIMCLWNPCTKEFKELPDRPIEFPSSESRWMVMENYGFGYDDDRRTGTNDYKVVRNLCLYEDGKFLHTLVEVYTLGTDSWKIIGNYPYEVSQHHIGLFVNNTNKNNNCIGGGGGVYWLARKSRYSSTIICFDIANEDYREIPNPASVPIKTTESLQFLGGHVSSSSENMKLAELKGFLCIINAITEHKCLEVWAMNKEEELNWSKLFTIKEPIIALPDPIQSSFELLGNFNNNGDEILVLVDRKDLALYNPKNDKTRLLIQIGDADQFNVQTYVESLVFLNSGSYIFFENTVGRAHHMFLKNTILFNWKQ